MEIETLAPVGIATHSEGLIFALEGDEFRKTKYPFVCYPLLEVKHELITGEKERFDIEDVAKRIGANLNIHTINFLKNEAGDVVICTVADWGEEEPRRNKLAEMLANRLKIISFGDKILGPALFCKVSDLDGIEL